MTLWPDVYFRLDLRVKIKENHSAHFCCPDLRLGCLTAYRALPTHFAMEQGNTTSNPEISFGEFSAATHEEWRAAAVAALKGADFDKSLYTRLVEGITLQPIYEKADVTSLEETPGAFPYRRGTRALGYTEKPWEVAQSISASTPEEYNQFLLNDLSRGLDAVNIQLNCRNGLKIKKQSQWSAALKDVVLNALPVYITPGSCGMAPMAMYINEYRKRGYDFAAM